MNRYYVNPTEMEEFALGEWVKYEDVQAAIDEAVAKERYSYCAAVGWMRTDGSIHKGCPPLDEPDGWVTVFARRARP